MYREKITESHLKGIPMKQQVWIPTVPIIVLDESVRRYLVCFVSLRPSLAQYQSNLAVDFAWLTVPHRHGNRAEMRTNGTGRKPRLSVRSFYEPATIVVRPRSTGFNRPTGSIVSIPRMLFQLISRWLDFD